MKTAATVLDQTRLTQAIRDPIWKHIYISPELLAAANCPPFYRLNRIRQLGPTMLVYPGASHTRSAHSYGVYHVARLLLEKLLQKGADDWVTPAGAASFLAAALFHDLGHFPYTHSLKELPLKNHEQLTAEILLSDPLKTLIAKSGADPCQTAYIVDHGMQTSHAETLFFRKLLSGVLDPDKIDYLNRDAFFCGVPYGIQDTDFILSRVLPDKEQGIVLDSSGILSIESLLFSKYLMYKSVYWHKHIRIATAMMKKTLFAAMEQGHIAPEELYSLDDESLFTLLDTKKFTEKKCSDQLRNGETYEIVMEIPFNSKNALHRSLEDLHSRSLFEKTLAEKLKIPTTDFLLDIPERISFESELWITDEQTSFTQSSTVFQKKTISLFTQRLRKIRLAIDKNTLKIPEIKKQIIAELSVIRYTILE